MFVRRRVENDLRTIFCKHFVDAPRVGDIGDHEIATGLDFFLAHVHIGFIQTVFRLIHHDQMPWLEMGDLPAKLGADGTARAGHHDDLVAQKHGDVFIVQSDRRAAQQIFELHFGQIAHRQPAIQQIL